jgi:hypothetical protein
MAHRIRAGCRHKHAGVFKPTNVRSRRYHAIPARIGEGLKSHPQATFGCGDFALIKETV